MNLDYAKAKVNKNVGVRHKFVYKGLRNQQEEFFGIISKMYPAIFTIILDNGELRAFSYSDFLIGNIEMID